MSETFLRGAQHLQNSHPLVVHFPIAFLTAAAVVYLVICATGRESWASTALCLLVVGTLSAAVAVGTGLSAEPSVMVARTVRTALLIPHKRMMLGSLGLSLVLTAWAAVAGPIPSKGRLAFVLLLLILLAALIKGADYGGRMVYDYNAGGDACGQPIEFSR